MNITKNNCWEELAKDSFYDRHYSIQFFRFKFKYIIHVLPDAAFPSAVFMTRVNYCFIAFRMSFSLVLNTKCNCNSSDTSGMHYVIM